MQRLADDLERLLGDAPMTAEEIAERILSERSPELLVAVRERLSELNADGTADVDVSVWGQDPGSRQDGFKLAEVRARVLADSLTREQVAERLSVTPQAVSRRLGARGLVALHLGRELRFPAWQFDDDGPRPGLAEVLAAWPGTKLALTVWATAPCADLDGARPADELSRPGGAARVLAVEEAVSPAAW